MTISKRADTWPASILIETEAAANPGNSGNPAVGVDVGINSLAVTDNGTEYENPKALRVNLRKLRRHLRSLIRKVYLSRNWQKAKCRLAMLPARIANPRMDAHHKASTDIVNRASVIGIETLTVSGLLLNRKLSRALSDAALSTFLTMIKYKTLARGVDIVEADKFFPSTKTCSRCSAKNKDITLADRTFTCTTCGFEADRDVNAAINLRVLAASVSESQNACGQRVRPALVGSAS